ncbi:MAG: hypothetical protein CMJ75_11635 [Planctomycetaceae bacterium]|nr:hypothetical protein [Planctomycetaceae bacterium]
MTMSAAIRFPKLSLVGRTALLRALILLIVATGVGETGTVAQVPAHLLEFNPRIKEATSPANWRLLDLGKAAGAPLAGNHCYGINAADLDHDGDVDLIVTFQAGGRRIANSNQRYGVVYWLENVTTRKNTPPTFHARVIDDEQLSPKVALIGPPADGRPSVVVPSYLSGETILYQSTAEMNWTKVRLRSDNLKEPVRAVMADIDGNGSDDIVVSSIAEAGEHLVWFRAPRSGGTNWEPVPIGKRLPPLVGVDTGDVDSDGDLDLVVASPRSTSPWLLLNLDGRGTQWKRQPLRTQPADSARRWVAQFSQRTVSQTHVRLTDVDRDGDLDCIETSLDCGYVAWRENIDGGKRWRFHSVAGKLPSAYCFDVGDLNRDGLPDMVVPSDGAGGVFIFQNKRQGAEWDVTHIDKGSAGLTWPNIIHLHDVNHDGCLDILATDWGRRAVVWLYRASQPAR